MKSGQREIQSMNYQEEEWNQLCKVSGVTYEAERV